MLSAVRDDARPASQRVQKAAPDVLLYVPSLHPGQDCWPVKFVAVPTGHGSQPRPMLNVPAVQDTHAVPAAAVPGAQVEQLVRPSPTLFVPLQTEHADWPRAGWYLPLGHSGHTVLPVAFANRPRSQIKHAVAPVVLTNEPVGHGVHEGVPAGLESEKCPAAHNAQLVLPVRACARPDGHGTQRCTPVSSAKNPAGHEAQAVMERLGAWRPATQALQTCCPPLPMALPRSQGMQRSAPVALCAVPAKQFVHPVLPASGSRMKLNLPPTHEEQEPEP